MYLSCSGYPSITREKGMMIGNNREQVSFLFILDRLKLQQQSYILCGFHRTWVKIKKYIYRILRLNFVFGFRRSSQLGLISNQ